MDACKTHMSDNRYQPECEDCIKEQDSAIEQVQEQADRTIKAMVAGQQQGIDSHAIMVAMRLDALIDVMLPRDTRYRMGWEENVAKEVEAGIKDAIHQMAQQRKAQELFVPNGGSGLQVVRK